MIPEDFYPLTDSRSLTDASHTIFFALRTPTGDGHRFIPELYRRGVRRFVVENDYADGGSCPDAAFIRVESPLKALQQAAADRRRRFAGRVVGITGSRGKTMVKEWLSAALGADSNVCRSPRSYNSQIGVPLSVLRLSAANDLGVFEAGISTTGEMEALNGIISPDIAVITNISSDHDNGFASRLDKLREKLLLARGARVLVYPADDAMIASEAVAFAAATPGMQLAGWSLRGNQARVQASADVAGDHTLLTFSTDDGRHGAAELHFTAPWQIENAMTVLTVLLALGIDPGTAASRLAELHPVGTRLQVSAGVNNSQVIHDDYSCDLSSLALALDFMGRRVVEGQPVTVILSDLDPDGADEQLTYRRAADLLRMRHVGRLIGVGPAMLRNFDCMGLPGQCYPDTEALLSHITPTDFFNQLVLVKGSPDFSFQRVVNMLEAKTHETVLEVNLDAMVDNFNFYRSKLRPGTGICAMVKASGYGAGSLELAKTLQQHGAAYLAVAVGDEGEELRRAGITMPIIILNPMVLNYKQLFENRLEPEIFSFDSLEAILYEARRAGIKRYPVHIKLDTGMHRLGFREEDLPRLLAILDGQEQVEVRSVFSHLCTADCLDQDEYTLRQLDYFTRCSQLIVDHFHHKIIRHVLNTAGILRFPQYQFDMVRLGIGLYGIPVINDGSEVPLRPISTLRTVVVAVHRWEAGETVGYGRRGVLTRPSVIATIPIGYADGFNRHCSRGNWSVMVNGVPCPTMGNICMDNCMIDVTDAAAAGEVRPGDPVVIFGPENPVTAMADMLDTIPYECLTSVSPRVRRVYYRES